MQPEERNQIEDLKKSIYSRNAPDIRSRRKMRTFSNETDIKTDWEHPPEEPYEPVVLNDHYESNKMSAPLKLLIASAVFCIVAVGVGAYLFLNGSNLISADNIAINVSGPVSVPGGTPITLSITVTNNNSVTLKAADLHIRFPAGTTDPGDTTVSMDSKQQLIGDIAPGASVTTEIKAVIFGEQNLQKDIVTTVTYGISGSSSVFTKEMTYEVLINSSPVILTASSFNKVTSGQPFDLAVEVKSNAADTLKNVALSAVYPFGFAFDSASIKPAAADGTVWSLGDIPPGGTRTLTIHGKVTGEDTELRSFHFTVGSQSQSNPLAIGTPFMETQWDMVIQKPFVSLSFSINGNASDSGYVGQFGRALSVNMTWENNLPEALSNVTVTSHFAGSAYDKTNVTSLDGYFRSLTDDIVWNQQTTPGLASVPAGGKGHLSFVVIPLDRGSAGTPVVNPQITISGTVSADRPSESNVSGSTAEISRVIKISSGASLSGRVLRTIGPFANSGPVPPRAEQSTTYTIVWDVDNTSNDLTNAVVTATLPPYISWANQISPSTEDISYDKNSSTVTWNVGQVGTYTIGTNRRREVQFQVSLMPSVSQVGQVPILVNQAHLTANDSWTSTQVTDEQSQLTTSYSTDPVYKGGDDTVQQ